MPTLSQSPTVHALRAHFPALRSETIFFENAGGSQVPEQAIQRMMRYLAESYVNTGGGYEASRIATRTLKDAHAFVNRFMGGEKKGRVAFGASTSQALRMLADCYLDILSPGDEIVIAETGHEANINPWIRLEKFGLKPVFWKLDPAARQCTMEGLEEALSPRTKLVVFPQVSNVLGDVVDVKAITKRVHEAGAEVVVDGVAYAPHDLMSVSDWDVDWYVYSTYKVFGPHMAALYGKHENWEKLTGPNHFFIGKDVFPGKFELGCPNHEGSAMILGLGDYLLAAIGAEGGRMPEREEIVSAWKLFNEVENPLTVRTLEYLACKPKVDVIGPKLPAPNRIGIISFLHDELDPNVIGDALCEKQIGARVGHSYAFRLCQALGIDTATGVVRVSFCHYNTIEEVERMIEVLDPIL